MALKRCCGPCGAARALNNDVVEIAQQNRTKPKEEAGMS